MDLVLFLRIPKYGIPVDEIGKIIIFEIKTKYDVIYMKTWNRTII